MPARFSQFLKYLDIKILDIETICYDGTIKDGERKLNQDGVHVWLIVWKAYDALKEHAMKSIESLDMCVTDFGILELLLHKGPANINVLGDKLSLASGSITAAIDRLEQRQYLRRTPSPVDRRAKVIELTKKGRQLIQQSFDTHSIHMESAVDGLTKKEREQLLVLLKKMGKSARQKLRDPSE